MLLLLLLLLCTYYETSHTHKASHIKSMHNTGSRNKNFMLPYVHLFS